MNSSVQITQATSYIGKQITWADSQGIEQTGIVTAIRIVNNEPKVMIGETAIEMKKIMSVTDAPVALSA